MVENQQYVIGEEMIYESAFTLVGDSWLSWIGCFFEIVSKTGKIYALLLEIGLKTRIEKTYLEFGMLKKKKETLKKKVSTGISTLTTGQRQWIPREKKRLMCLKVSETVVNMNSMQS